MPKLTQENTMFDIPDLNRFRIGDEVVVDASQENDRFEGTIIGIELRRSVHGGPFETDITLLHDDYVTDGFKPADCRKVKDSPVSGSGRRSATVEDYNAAFDPADEILGGAFKAGFKEGWIYAETDADGDRYQEMVEEYGMAVDTAPGECWDAHREKFFAMLPLAAIPEVGAAIRDVDGEIARVIQSVNEWDDRTSPDDYPEHLLITSEELADILRNFAATLEVN